MRGLTKFPQSSLLFKSIHITIRSPSLASARHQPRRSYSFTSLRMAPTRDPNTLSNYGAWLTKHTTVNFKINFEKQRLEGSVSLDLESLTDKESNEIILDTTALDVSSVKLNAADLKWELKQAVKPYGSPLHIAVPEGAQRGDVVRLDIAVTTTKDCTGLQWMTPAQTGNKKHPYVYSQCQAILARSILPCQDTPDVKSTFTFNITSSLPVVASGVPVPSDNSGEGERLFRFEQKVPIPSYLFALASGDIATAPIGKRSVVAAGPEAIKAAQWELEGDMDKFLDVAQNLIFDYQWGEYNVLNPIFTFATPTIISGDRQNVDVIAHELSHSWSGNLGWTTYLERRIGAAIHGGPQFDFSAIIGWKALEDTVKLFGDDHEFTKLIISHKGVDPEDAFSTIPYEKGFHFLWYLERLVGREQFDKFIPHYFKTWARKSLDSYEFKATFLDYFNEHGTDEIKQKVAQIPWEEKFHQPGLPPKPEFDTSYVDSCMALAEKWKPTDFKPDLKDIESFNSNQTLVFLQAVQDFSPCLSVERAQLLGSVYNISSSKNVELKTAYYGISLRAGDRDAFPGVVELLGSVGRMKFVRPLYRQLVKLDRDLAVETYEKNKDFYPSTTKSQLAKDLGLR
ncbi:hypothetical protein PG985_015527 [Apiospora marii]|uniref:uncharacterized protein n=1 Tax=Apiospora marii TaxID=335849 RepID=UPI00312EF04F